MKIKMLDLKKIHEPIRDELIKGFEEVLDSNRFILGPYVENFEKELSQYLGGAYVVGVGNGTDALTISLTVLGIGPGDEVITTPFTFVATAETISLKGARPVFVDIEPDTYTIDPEKIEEKITKNTKAILPVHLYGQAVDMDPIIEIAKRHNLYIIEDGAQSIGVKYKGRYTCTIGDLGTLSFYPSKNLSCLGDGGAVITKDEKLYNRLKILRIHGATSKYYHEYLGFNSRLDAIQAKFLSIKLKYLDELNQKRRKIAEKYSNTLKEYVKVPVVKPYSTHIFHQYTIYVERRDELMEYLKENGIPSQVHYPTPLHLQPAFSYLGYKEGDFPVAEDSAKHVLSLPVHPYLEDEEIEYIIEKIIKFYKNL